MATLREYFDADQRVLSVHNDWQVHKVNGDPMLPITAKVFQDIHANAKYWAFFVPDGVDIATYAQCIFRSPETAKCTLSSEGDPTLIKMGFADRPDEMTSATLVFTGRVFLYVDQLMEAPARQALSELGARHGLNVVVHDRSYALKKSELEKPLAFISHDTRDKDALVRALALELSSMLCPVWYDEYSLKVGASLRESIEKGLKETRRCIVILSPRFLSNEGWSKAEFDSIYTREIVEKKNVILPVWHEVGVEDVYQYSPRLADKVGLSSTLGVKELARRLFNAIKEPTAH